MAKFGLCRIYSILSETIYAARSMANCQKQEHNMKRRKEGITLIFTYLEICHGFWIFVCRFFLELQYLEDVATGLHSAGAVIVDP